MKRIDFDKKRYPAKTLTPKEWSKQRIAAAKRALKKEKERAGLFPELMRFNSAEERMEQADSNFLERVVFYRKKIADDWFQSYGVPEVETINYGVSIDKLAEMLESGKLRFDV